MIPPSPAELPFKVASSNYLQFPLIPPAKVPYKISFNFPWFPKLKYLTKFPSNSHSSPSQITFQICKLYFQRCYKNVIYDIGTKILIFQCFCIMENHIFSNSIFFRGIGSIFRALSFGTIKTRFKAFWDIFLKICMRTWIRRLRFFIKFCPRRAT